MPRIVILLLALSTFSACSASPRIQTHYAGIAAGATPIRVSYSTATVRDLLGGEFRRWRGTPHRLGGTGDGGFDCSGFAQHLFDHLFAVRLPRTTTHQVNSGKAIDRRSLRPGDLVFFRPPSYQHVGVYVGDNEFIHASSSRGITRSRLDSSYWRRHYWTARRVIMPQDLQV